MWRDWCCFFIYFTLQLPRIDFVIQTILLMQYWTFEWTTTTKATIMTALEILKQIFKNVLSKCERKKKKNRGIHSVHATHSSQLPCWPIPHFSSSYMLHFDLAIQSNFKRTSSYTTITTTKRSIICILLTANNTHYTKSISKPCTILFGFLVVVLVL